MTTKEQERKALAKIREIIDGLGENSYISTAFAGCLEDASENIENDFACSMKDRWENAVKELQETRSKLYAVQEQIARADEKIGDLNARTIDDNDARQIAGILRAAWNDAENRKKSAGASVLETCGNPESEEFRTASAAYKKAFSDSEKAHGLLEKILKNL